MTNEEVELVSNFIRAIRAIGESALTNQITRIEVTRQLYALLVEEIKIREDKLGSALDWQSPQLTIRGIPLCRQPNCDLIAEIL